MTDFQNPVCQHDRDKLSLVKPLIWSDSYIVILVISVYCRSVRFSAVDKQLDLS